MNLIRWAAAKSKNIVSISASLVLMLPALARDKDTESGEGGIAVIGPTFTYQGLLKQSGMPINGTCDLQFSLWNAAAGPAQVGSTQQFLAQTVTDGLVTKDLNFGAGAFDGNDRWIEVAVRSPAGSGSYTTLAPRQKINAAPYSLWSLAGGSGGLTLPFTGSASSGSALFTAQNTGTGGGLVGSGNVGVGGTSTSATGYGVIGVKLTNGGASIYGTGLADVGVSGETNNSAGIGVKGLNVATGNNGQLGAPNEGAFGRHQATGNYGQLGTSTAGVEGRCLSSASGQAAIRGTNSGNGAVGEIGTDLAAVRGTFAPTGSVGLLGTFAYGVYGQASASLSTGVYGEGSWVGVQGVIQSNTGITYGVVGRTNSPSGFDFLADGAGVNYGSSSSRRWKTNISSVDSPLTMISKLRGVFFDWDAQHGGHHDIGMIAEEVGAVLPEVVTYEANGVDAIGMDYSKMTPLLVEAVNALRVEKDAQLQQRDAEIAALREANSSLEQRLAKLEAALEVFVK